MYVHAVNNAKSATNSPRTVRMHLFDAIRSVSLGSKILVAGTHRLDYFDDVFTDDVFEVATTIVLATKAMINAKLHQVSDERNVKNMSLAKMIALGDNPRVWYTVARRAWEAVARTVAIKALASAVFCRGLVYKRKKTI